VRVITEQMPHVRSVSVGIWIASGSRRETAEESGITHFTEHMVFKGTKKRSAEQIARAADSIGGGLDAFTSKELVSFNCKVLDEHVPIAFDIISDLVLNPVFRPEDIEREKGVILEELKMESDSPESMLHEMFSRTFWKGHALGRPILGTRRTVRSFDRDKLFDFHRQAYSPANILITAAGSLKHKSGASGITRRSRRSRTRSLCSGPRNRSNRSTCTSAFPRCRCRIRIATPVIC
jgi:predicted Zn-dependent peptidase